MHGERGYPAATGSLFLRCTNQTESRVQAGKKVDGLQCKAVSDFITNGSVIKWLNQENYMIASDFPSLWSGGKFAPAFVSNFSVPPSTGTDIAGVTRL